MLKHPPPSDCCRLCVRSCNDDQHILYDETGQANTNHALVGKYFTSAMLNMEWEKRLQYICGKCWQHIWKFHQFQETIIEAQKGQHLHTEEAKEVKIKPELDLHINQQEVQLELHITKRLSASTEDLIKPTALTIDIKTEEPLDLNSDYEGMSFHDVHDHSTNEEMSLMMSSRKENSSLQNDDESNEYYGSDDGMSLSSLGQTNHCSSDKKVPSTKKSVQEFDEMVALWRSCLECEICHQLVNSYSQLKDHFSENHASEGCYLMCCQLRLETCYDIDRHIRYHNAPQQLKCEACCKVYRWEKTLRRHKRNVHSSKGGDKHAKDSEKLEGKYRCCKCSKDFVTEQHLNRHNNNVHKLKILECNFCEKTFMHPYALREHLASHKGEKMHVCSFCPKEFTWRSNFCTHMRKSHPQEWKKMQDEEVQREPKCRYRRETRGETMVYVCIYCSVEYENRTCMQNHIRCCPRRDQPTKSKKLYRRETRGESMVYVCSFCSREYENRFSIYGHVRRCQGSDRPIDSKKGYRRESRGTSMVYVCVFCSKEYRNSESIHYHIYHFHREEASLARQQAPMSAMQLSHSQRTPVSQDSLNRIIGSNANDVANITPDGYNLNELGKEGEEDSLMTPVEGKEWKYDENATSNVKTEQLSADENSLENEEMNEKDVPQEFEDAAWESGEFLKSEEEFIEL
uniref:C2H2-type domain-containing protein n=1 Tax=Stomoxys calcitrans TaxID=35570 RepID=A0A1I8P2E8_STOCA